MWYESSARAEGTRSQFCSCLRGHGPEEVGAAGRVWARAGRATGSMVCCTGADAARLKSRLVDVIQP